MNSKKTTSIAHAIGDIITNSLCRAFAINRWQISTIGVLLVLALSQNNVYAQTTCHTFECPDDITISIQDPMTCDTMLTIGNFPLPDFTPGEPVSEGFVNEFCPEHWHESFHLTKGNITKGGPCCPSDGFTIPEFACEYPIYGIWNTGTMSLVGIELDGTATLLHADIHPEVLNSAQMVNGYLVTTKFFSDELFVVDPTDGSVTQITVGCTIVFVDYDPTSGTLYGIGNSQLFRIDLDIEECGIVGATCSPIGPIQTGGIIEMVIDNNGQGYLIDFGNDQIIPFDPTTGITNGPLVPLNFDSSNAVSGFDIDCPPGGGPIYGYQINNGMNQFFTLDPSTGIQTIITPDTGTNQVLGMSFCDDYPKSESMSLEGSTDANFLDVDTYTDVCLYIPCDGNLEFTWDAVMRDDTGGLCGNFNGDEASYVLNGVEIILTNPFDNEDLANNESICVEAGDAFCFRVNSMNDNCRVFFDIYDFSFSPNKDIALIQLIPPAEIGADCCIENGSFETGDYTGWDVMDIPLPFLPATVNCFPSIIFDPITALDGSCYAYNGFDGGGPGMITTCQTVILPTTALGFHWSDWLAYDLMNFGATMDRMLAVTVDGTMEYSFSAMAGTFEQGTGWINHSIDITGYAGQTVEICFVEDIPENFTGPAQIGIDDVRISTDPNNYLPGEYTMQYKYTFMNGCMDFCEFDLKVEAYDPGGLTCKELNFSLDDINCEGMLTPAMVVTNDEPGCFSNYEIYAYDEYGNEVELLTGEHIGQAMTYKVCIPSLDLCCWNNLTVEDKLPPVIQCDTLEVDCHNIDSVADPVIISNNCGDTELILLDEDIEHLDCDNLYTAEIRRKWTARDKSGNYAEECIQLIYVLRPPIMMIQPPDAYTGDNALECQDYHVDEYGFPLPGVETDVPTLNGLPIWPVTPEMLCNASIRYIDVLQVDATCKQTILRTWEIREWHCSGENFVAIPQVIQIKDTEGPHMYIPEDMTVSVGMDCAGHVFLPAIQADDVCNDIDRIDITAPADFAPNGGLTGAYLMLEVGKNKIYYTAYDVCYNKTIDSLYVTVVDDREPVVVCDPVPIIYLDLNGNAELQAYQIDEGSYDECGPVILEIAKVEDQCEEGYEEFGKSIEFCCEEIGFVMVILQATDISGNTNQCMMQVEIASNVPPQLIINPIDTTVVCTTTYDLDNLSQFGEPQVYGACNDLFEEDAVATIDQCGIGKIERTFTVFSGTGGIHQKTQTIYFENPDPFDGTMDIDWPADTMFTEICFMGDTKTLIPPLMSGEPKFTKDDCDLIGVNFEDELIKVDGILNACYKIHRTWKVVDWCQKDENDQYLKWDSLQIIEVKDTLLPEITSDPLTVLDTVLLKTCEELLIEVPATGTTNCDTIVKWEYEIRDIFGVLQADSMFTQSVNDTARAHAYLQDGEYTIQWILRDGCGNFDLQDGEFVVRNKKLPTAYAKSISVPLQIMGLDTQAVVWVQDVDNGSYHECGYTIDLSFEKDVDLNFLVFTCEDKDSTHIVELWVTDQLGNKNYVTVGILITDEAGVCEPYMPTVAGQLMSSRDMELPNVEVNLIGAELPPDLTNEYGEFAFAEMPGGGSYTVRPYNDKDPLNGVSTLDIVMIQRHVLGTTVLDDPYQLIAADINGSADVSAIDLVELRKMILGIYDDFPNNTSWRFIDASHDFPVPQDPWLYELPEAYFISNLQTDMFIPFTGIKTGDVNFSAESNLSNISAENRSNKMLDLLVEEMSDQGHGYKYAISLNEAIALSGMQFELKYDGRFENIINIEAADLQIKQQHVYFNDARKVMALSWNAHDEQYIDGNILMILHSSEALDLSKLSLDHSRISPELYENGLIYELNLKAINRNLEIAQLSALVYPNPWQVEAVIEVVLSEESHVSIEIIDVSGKSVFATEQWLIQGENRIVISEKELPAAGVYYCIIDNGTEQVRKKMIKIK